EEHRERPNQPAPRPTAQAIEHEQNERPAERRQHGQKDDLDRHGPTLDDVPKLVNPAQRAIVLPELVEHGQLPSGRSSGKVMTSRIDACEQSVMIKRSMPMPKPPAGGMPYSSART